MFEQSAALSTKALPTAIPREPFCRCRRRAGVPSSRPSTRIAQARGLNHLSPTGYTQWNLAAGHMANTNVQSMGRAQPKGR